MGRTTDLEAGDSHGDVRRASHHGQPLDLDVDVDRSRRRHLTRRFDADDSDVRPCFAGDGHGRDGKAVADRLVRIRVADHDRRGCIGSDLRNDFIRGAQTPDEAIADAAGASSPKRGRREGGGGAGPAGQG